MLEQQKCKENEVGKLNHVKLAWLKSKGSITYHKASLKA
mgnify:CR=1 FL=1